jgi:uncharacterized cupin superfamily protein
VRRFNVLSGELDLEKEHRPGYHHAYKRVGDELGAKTIGASLYELAADERICPYHYHHGVEEWLYVVSGEPVVRTPAGERPLRPGDVVCFPGSPDGAHTVRGPGRVLMFGVNRWPAVVVYPDSDKLGTRPAERGTYDADRLNFVRRSAVDYFEGEQ